MYFEGTQVKSLVLTLRDRFLGAKLTFDAYSPIHVLRHIYHFCLGAQP
ncbi:MAG: hypothetical protein HZB51_32695 [Chloroflexi bacterium]|nr:hypothetical protein [Chloroflexota bacterium]